MPSKEEEDKRSAVNLFSVFGCKTEPAEAQHKVQAYAGGGSGLPA